MEWTLSPARRSRIVFGLLALALAGLLSLWILERVRNPFVWIPFVGVGCFLVLWVLFPQPLARKFWVNGLLVCFTFLATETQLLGWWKIPLPAKAENKKAMTAPATETETAVAKTGSTEAEAGREGVETSTDYFLDDWNLGYRPRPNVEFTYTQFTKGKKLFESTFEIDACSHRTLGRAPRPTAAQEAALFFGDSFTFGIGANGDEVYPAQFERIAGSKWFATNLAFQGYGAHQVLRILEKKWETRCHAGPKPRVGFYLAQFEHVYWAAGQTGWENPGPKYELDQAGGVYYSGQYQNLLWLKLKRRLERSLTLRKFFSALQKSRRSVSTPEYDLQRYVGVVARASELFEQRYGGKFYVLYWEGAGSESKDENQRLLTALRERSLNVIPVSEAIPDLFEKRQHYVYEEGHPTPLAHRLLAEYLLHHAI